MDPFVIITSFIGTLAALVITKTIERSVVRILDAQDLTRDLLLDLTSHLTAVEDAHDQIVAAATPLEYSHLQATTSGWDMQPPAIKLERLLSVFSDENIHHPAVLYYERYDRFVRWSKQHEEAYYWLLDHPEVSWDGPQAGERRERIKFARNRMCRLTKEMLQFGYQLVELLADKAGRFGLPTMTRPTSADDFLRSKLGHTKESLRQRRAFYSLRNWSFAFQATLPHSFAIWHDELSERVRLRKGCLLFDVEYTGDGGVVCKGTVALDPGREVALPSTTVFSSGRLWWPGMSDSGISIINLPARVDQLQNHGNSQGLISLGPGDFSTAARRLDVKQSRLLT
jgi:hypothetical protein